MRRPTTALVTAALGIALSAPMLSAQQDPPESPPPIYPMMSARGASHVLRTGWDYITYQEYERALQFFREAEGRQSELSDAERQTLKQGIERAQRGMREATNSSTRTYAISGTRRPGAIALAPSAGAAKAPAPAGSTDPIRLTSGDPSAPGRVEPAVPSLPADSLAAFPKGLADPAPALTPAPAPSAQPALADTPRAEPAVAPAVALAPLSAPDLPAPAPAPPLAPAALESAELPPLSSEPSLPTEAPSPLPDRAPRAEEPPSPPAARTEAPVPEPTAPVAVPNPESEALPPLPDMAAPDPVEPPPAPSAESIPVPVPAPSPAPAQDAADLPPLPAETSSGLVSTPVAEPPPSLPAEPTPIPSPAAESLPPLPETAPTPPARTAPRPPAPSASDSASETLPPLPAEPSPGPDPKASSRTAPRDLQDAPSTLSPELQREVDQIAQQQDAEDMRRDGDAARPSPGEVPIVEEPGYPDSSTQLELPRAPSPTEARPLKAIPVPEEFVPLAPRDWAPNRKVWAAPGVCNMPLYFQDAALERYGQTAEQYVGPLGRYLSYPLDDPTQSNQRNQIAQPFFSIGLFAAQIAMLPYNLLVDPPWEAQYDLGFYRPGDRVPTDVYYFPLHGIGPPLHGSNY